EGAANLDLPVFGPDVKVSRRADRRAGPVPDLGEGDLLAAGREVFRIANEGAGLVESGRRRPGEIPADFLVPHGVEDARGVVLIQGLERDVTAPKRDGSDFHWVLRQSGLLRRGGMALSAGIRSPDRNAR